MTTRTYFGPVVRSLAAAAGAAAGAYAAYVGVTWLRYGRPVPPAPEEADPLLDRFIPVFDVVDRHHIRVNAPAPVTLDVARRLDLFDSPVSRAIFRGRELILGSTPHAARRPRGLLEEVQSLGWVVLAEIPDREIVLGTVTRPWEPDVTFRPVPADGFAAFAEPDYVKIAWTIRADPVGEHVSVFRTETRAVATSPAARARFRRYWSFLSPGILLIRSFSLGPVRTQAERLARQQPDQMSDVVAPAAGSSVSGMSTDSR